MTSTTPSHPDAALVEAVATGLATDIADAILAPLVHEMIDGTPAWELRLVADWLPLTRSGVAAAVAFTVVTLAFAYAQYLGVRRLDATPS